LPGDTADGALQPHLIFSASAFGISKQCVEMRPLEKLSPQHNGIDP
jgi:hypothetical protein